MRPRWQDEDAGGRTGGEYRQEILQDKMRRSVAGINIGIARQQYVITSATQTTRRQQKQSLRLEEYVAYAAFLLSLPLVSRCATARNLNKAPCREGEQERSQMAVEREQTPVCDCLI